MVVDPARLAGLERSARADFDSDSRDLSRAAIQPRCADRSVANRKWQAAPGRVDVYQRLQQSAIDGSEDDPADGDLRSPRAWAAFERLAGRLVGRRRDPAGCTAGAILQPSGRAGSGGTTRFNARVDLQRMVRGE